MIGMTIGGCRLLEQIGEGGFGTVYKATQTSLDRCVAVKVFSPNCSGQTNSSAALDAASMRLAGKLEHPNIIRTYYCGTDSDVPFVVMEYVEGKTLDKTLAEGPMPLDTVLYISIQIAMALDYAHERGIIHADLNPRNIIMTKDNRPVLGDFLGSQPGNSEARNVVGVPEYLSPEQAKGLDSTPKSDIYSLGIIIYEMLTGHPPFSEDTPSDTLFRQISSEPVPPSKVNKNIPARLDKLVMRMLAKNPEIRHESCEAVAKELEMIRSELLSGGKGRLRQGFKPVNPLLTAALLLVIGAMGCVGYLIQQTVAEERELDAIAAASLSLPAQAAADALESSVIVRYNEEMRRGQNLLEHRQYRAAATTFHRACKLRPDQVDPHLFLAAIFIEREDFRLAKAELDCVLEMDPENKEALSAMKYVQTRIQE